MDKVKAFIQQPRNKDPKEEGEYLCSIWMGGSDEEEGINDEELKKDIYSFKWKDQWKGKPHTLMPGWQYQQFVSNWYKEKEGYFLSEEQYEEIKSWFKWMEENIDNGFITPSKNTQTEFKEFMKQNFK